jgi:hypothetical protein
MAHAAVRARGCWWAAARGWRRSTHGPPSDCCRRRRLAHCQCGLRCGWTRAALPTFEEERRQAQQVADASFGILSVMAGRWGWRSHAWWRAHGALQDRTYMYPSKPFLVSDIFPACCRWVAAARHALGRRLAMGQ